MILHQEYVEYNFNIKEQGNIFFVLINYVIYNFLSIMC